MKKLIFITFLLGIVFTSCSKNDAGSPSSNVGSSASGTAGSMARFAIVGENLYTVTSTNVKIFDIKNASNPIYKVDQPFGVGIETIFPLGNTLFLGSERGMYIYDITNPLSPKLESVYTHVLSCDPVVANEKFAYLTLSTGATRCSRGLNQLEVIDITNKKQPKILKIFPMTRPLGLALNGNNLFVCDDKVKWFDATNSPNLVPKGIINVRANDVIALNNILMLITDNDLVQYDYSGTEPKFLSRIQVGL